MMTPETSDDDPNPYAAPSAGDDSSSPPLNDRRYPLREQVTVDVDTFAQAMDVHSGLRRPLLRVIAFLVALLSGGVSAVFLFVFDDASGAFVFFVFAVFLMFFAIGARLLRRRIVQKRLRQMSREHQDVLYEVTPECLRISTEDGESRLKWENLFKWKEGNGILLLYRHGAFYHVVPVGEFDVETQNAIREFLQARSR